MPPSHGHLLVDVQGACCAPPPRLQVNMLAREYCDDIKRKNKPIVLSHKCV